MMNEGNVKVIDEGFFELENELNSFLTKFSNNEIKKILELGAKSFTNDLLKLPSPRSKVKKSGYKHLVDSFSYEWNSKRKEVEVGWGKYYGLMVENGTKSMKSQPHIKKAFVKKRSNYYNQMLQKVYEI
jgi:HK97 gp10 family phage protein